MGKSGSPLDIFKIMYMYRYRKSKKLLTSDGQGFTKIVDECYSYIETLKGKEQKEGLKVMYDMLTDIKSICGKEEKYKEVLDMINVRTYSESEKIERRGIKKGKEVGKEEGKEEGKQEAIKESISKVYKETKDKELIYRVFGCDENQLSQILMEDSEQYSYEENK